MAAEYDEPNGVPIDVFLFGGRRATTVPLVYESRDWNHGTYVASCLSSETTAAAAGAVGVVRRDPMAMLPFIGYHAGDYMQHWINIGKTEGAQLPRIYQVNWFRKDEDGHWLWPGFGDNVRVLKWIVDRLEGKVDVIDSPIGLLPKPEDIDVSGLDMPADDVAKAVAYDPEAWKKELPLIEEWMDKFGDKLPAEIKAEFDKVKAAVAG